MTHQVSKDRLLAMLDAGKRDFFAKGGLVNYLPDEIVADRGINCCPLAERGVMAPRLVCRDEHEGIMKRPENNE